MKKLLAIFIFTYAAYGSILFEPYVGLTIEGKVDEDGIDGNFYGNSFGARLGAQYLYVFGGFDYRVGRYSVDSDENTILEDDTLNNERYYAFVGYEFPMFFKVWAGAALGGVARAENVEYEDGGGYVVGVGYKGLPIINLNLEYESWDYGKSDPDVGELEGNHILFSLSTPINF